MKLHGPGEKEKQYSQDGYENFEVLVICGYIRAMHLLADMGSGSYKGGSYYRCTRCC